MTDSRGVSSTPLGIDGLERDHAARSASARYWMRGVSFATLHRALCFFAGSKSPVRSRDISSFVRGDLDRVRGVQPGATTIYRYRSTLDRLGLMSRQGSLWRVELANPLVCALVTLCPGEGASLVAQAKVHFAEAVLKHPDCRDLLLDLFMPDGSDALDFNTFCTGSTPVVWRHVRSGEHSRLLVWNRKTGQRRCYEDEQAVLSLLYGVRYWLRDELEIVDEYAELGENTVIMFAVYPVPERKRARETQVLDAVRFVLSARTDAPWTTLEVAGLIRRYCVERRQARRVLFAALDWLCRHRASSVVLVPTPVGVATLSASSVNREHLELGRYYRDGRGRLIGDVRVHADSQVP